ncbi:MULTISPECIES: HAD family hydrolase [Dyella]|uniref:HAD family hydrolase n=2 Tax=Dyella TaxID=231454 RepID=A0A4R0YWK2_9GAMM|nr:MULTISPECIES: HAD family hydrolase [Dyella]TBR40677.1 HAD family hydrolase [Dyella terrae]TCI13853.1 HAD family hydrolase [Dyella soli]
MIELVGFDADDTLWHSECYYRDAQDEFEQIIGRYVDLKQQSLHERLLAIERRNLKVFGYGAKAMTLSMIEAAVDFTNARISAADIHRIVGIGKHVLSHPVKLLPGVRDAVEAVAARYKIVLITKGDLFHQERKVAQCGLADLFHRIEIVSEKDEAAYRRVLAEFDLAPGAFAMIGNSLRSDIAPVVGIGGWGIHIPYHLLWAHEADTDFAAGSPRVVEVKDASGIAAALEQLDRRAAA